MLKLNDIYCMDCIEFLNQIQDKSIDLCIIDPPYFQVMKSDWRNEKYHWDNQWKNIHEYINWISEIAKEVKRVLKLNGSFYIFADDRNAAYIQVELDKMFNLENNIVWIKPNNMTIKAWKDYRCYCPLTERILFYSNESRNSNLENELYAENIKIFSPVVEYMIEQKKKIKEYFRFKTDKEFNDYVNKITNTRSVVSRHYFTYSQWVFPTKELYQKLQSINKNIFKKEYEELKKEYEEKRRIFNQKKNYTDVWTFNIMGGSETVNHPTQKPLSLIKRIINTSSNKGDIILDCFIGSGTTAVAAKQLGRKFIGCDNNQDYVDITKKRINDVYIQPSLQIWEF